MYLRFLRLPVTLDKNGWLAQVGLNVTQINPSTFKSTKASPVEKGSTETIYNSDGKITTRIITTATNLKYFLKVRTGSTELPWLLCGVTHGEIEIESEREKERLRKNTERL